MEKLVTCHRLFRPKTHAFRYAENREGTACSHGLTNPLYSAIIATNLKEGVELNKLVERFFFINRTLERLEVVRSLCVLGQGTVTWCYTDENQQNRPALFMFEDLYKSLSPRYTKMPEAKSALYYLMADLMLHLFHSILAPEDIAVLYGSLENVGKFPTASNIVLPPDRIWAANLNKPYEFENDICDHDRHSQVIARRGYSIPRKPKKRH